MSVTEHIALAAAIVAVALFAFWQVRDGSVDAARALQDAMTPPGYDSPVETENGGIWE